MKDDKEKIEYNEDMDVSEFFKIYSATECTGLIPSAVQSDYEIESYNELINFLPTPENKIGE